MSNTIDNRVVELEFDNSKFESNVKTSLSTLDKLKSALSFKGATKGLEEVESAAGNVNMSGLGSAVETVQEKFSMLKVMAVGALMDIGRQAKDAGIKLVKSLSVDQITAGFSKYEDKTQSVQTIMNATGKSIDEVSSALDRLNWFTDETSYNFTDMVSNVGKFTSNQIDLDESIDAMQGIATWAGLSGANTQEASRAMYNMAQAIGVGAVKLQDWKSIENANMATAGFKETVINTAVELGTLTEVSDGLYRTLAGHEVTIKNFNENLKDGWFSSEVLMQSLSKYGAFATKLQEATDKMRNSASEAIEYIDEYKEGILDINEASKETGLTAEELTEILDELSSEEYELGLKAFKASQEAKTFTEAIEATKDAVSTGWMQTFEHIFGNYEEAKELWTDLANDLYDLFAKSGNRRNEILAIWHEDGGREAFINSLRNAFEGLVSILDRVKEAFTEVFPALADEPKNVAEKLTELTKKLEAFTEKFKMSEETATNLRNTFKGFFAILKIGKEVISAVFNGIKPLLGIFPKLGVGVLGVTGGFGEWLSKLADTIHETGIFTKVVEVLVSVITFVPRKLKEAFSKVEGTKIGEGFSSIVEGLKSFKDKIKELLGGFDFSSILSKIGEGAGKVLEFIGKFIKTIAENVDFDKLMKLAKSGVFVLLGTSITKFIDSLTKAKSESTGIKGTLSEIAGSIQGVFGSLSSTIAEFKNQIKTKELLNIAIAVGVLTASVYALSNIDAEKMAVAMSALTVEIGELMGALFVFSKLSTQYDLSSMKKMAKSMLIFAAAVYVIAAAMKKLAELSWQEVLTGGLGITIIAGVLVAASQLLARNNKGLIKGTASLILFAIAIRALVKPIQELGGMEAGPLVQGILGIIAVMELLILSLKAMGGTASAIKQAFTLIVLALALKMVVKPLKSLAEMTWPEIAKGLVAMTGALVVMALVTGLLGKLAAGSSIVGALAMIGMALALKMIADPLKSLGEMEWGQIGVALAAMAGAFVIMGVVAGLLGTFAPSSILGALTMVAMAIALKMIVDPMKSLGTMKWEQVGVALAAMGGAFVIMGAVAGLLGVFSPASILGALSMVVMAKALQMIAEPMQALGQMQWGEIGRSLTAMLGAFVIMGGITAALGIFSVLSVAGALALAAVAGALKTAVEPLKELSTMSWSEIGRGLTAMAGIFAVLQGALLGVNLFAGIKANAFKDLSDTIANITNPLKTLGSMDWDELKRSLTAMKTVFAELETATGDFHFSDFFAGVKADTFVTLSEAIKNMAPGIRILANLDQDAVKATLDTLGEAFKSFGESLAATPMWGSTFRANGIGALVSNIDSLAQSLPGFIAIDEESAKKALEALSEGFKGFGEALTATPFWGSTSRAEGIGALISNIDSLVSALPAIKEIGADDVKANMSAIAEGFTEFGAAIKNSPFWGAGDKAAAIVTVTDSISTLATGLKQFLSINKTKDEIDAAIENIKNVISTVGTVMKDFPSLKSQDEDFSTTMTTLKDNLPSVVNALKNVQTIDQKTVTETLGNSAVAVAMLGNAFSNFDIEGGKVEAFEKVMNVFKTVLPVLKEVFPAIEKIDVGAVTSNLNGAANSIISFCESLSDITISLDGFEKNATDAGNKFATSFGDALKNNKSTLISTFGTVVSELVSAIRQKYNSFYQAGGYLITGFAQGIKMNTYLATNAASSAAKSAVKAANAALGISSPSKVFKEIGMYVDLGFAEGLDKYASIVMTASENVASGAVDSANSGLSEFGDIFNLDSDNTMTITPVLDLSNLQRDKDSLSKELADISASGVRTSMLIANQNAANMAIRHSGMQTERDGIEKLTNLIKTLIDNPPSNNYNDFHITSGNPEEVAEIVSERLRRDIVRRNSVWA